MTDRINYYYNNEEILCQSNCKFAKYSLETSLLKCECDVTNSEIDTKATKKFSEKTLYQSFYDILKFSNYKVLICHKLAFHINSIKNNKGSIMAIIYISIFLLFLIIYCFKGIKQLKMDFIKRILKNKDIIYDVPKSENNTKLNEKQEKPQIYPVNNNNKIKKQKKVSQNNQNTTRTKNKSKTTKKKQSTHKLYNNLFYYPPKKNTNSRDIFIAEIFKYILEVTKILTNKGISVNHLSNYNLINNIIINKEKPKEKI